MKISLILFILFLLIVAYTFSMKCEGMGMYSGALSNWIMERT